MNDRLSKKSRKDWIKNIAIVFLAIMLFLTFFSNTIMNYSLSEVATEYVQSGSITAKVRGTGTVEAEDPYVVNATESRTIASVPVKVGDTVFKDQILFYLEDKESEELAAAEAELDALLLVYAQQILSGEISDTAFQNAQNGSVSNISTYQAQIATARVNIENAESVLTAAENTAYAIQKQIDILNNETVDTWDEEQAVTKATEALTKANEALLIAEANLNAASGEVAGLPTLSEATGAVTVALLEEANKKAACEVAIDDFNDTFGKSALLQGVDTRSFNNGNMQSLVLLSSTESESDTNNITDTLDGGSTNASGDEGNLSNEDSSKDTVIVKLSFDIVLENPGENEKAISDLKADDLAEINKVDGNGEKFPVVQTTYSEYITARNARVAAESVKAQVESSDLSSLEKAVSDAQSNATTCENNLSSAQDTLSALQNTSESTASKESLANQLIEANEAILKATEAVEKANSEYADLITDIQAQLNLGDQNDKISEKREEIEELKAKATGASVVAPVDGTITGVNKVAGESTSPDETLATIQVAGKGFSLSFSVTTDQAKNVQVGDLAELQNSWYYDEITAKLTAIKPEPSSPNTQKILYFEITGETVQSGTSLSLSVGNKNANYDYVVPNSAVREDNNGNFILIVESKSSPLGNRYIATRIDVEVLASDDTHTAISGALYGYEYVITTATKPVEAGEQIRLSES